MNCWHLSFIVIDKINCNICDQILEGLELIDDECDVFGIHMVKIQDPQLAKRYSIKTFPALVYFRNGNPLLFEGDMSNEQSVLEWLIDDDNRELADEIEEVRELCWGKIMFYQCKPIPCCRSMTVCWSACWMNHHFWLYSSVSSYPFENVDCYKLFHLD